MRAYHSVSSVKLGKRCQRAWAYRYIDGLKAAEVSWEAIEAGATATSKQRSLALGKAVHAASEAYYAGKLARWESLPGQILASGLGLVPSPKVCTRIEVEMPIGNTPCADAEGGTALSVEGLLWVGFRDLAFYAGSHVLQADWKTSSNIGAWAMTPAQLAEDLQCALYTYDLCTRLSIDVLHSRWVYVETKRIRRALAVDTWMSLQQGLAIIGPAAELARKLDTIVNSAEAEPNPLACQDYGGCEYHIAAGGPCLVRKSLGAMYAQLKGSHMPLDPNLAAKFQALGVPMAQATPPAPPAQQPAPPAAPAGFGAPPPAQQPAPPAAPAGFGAPPAPAQQAAPPAPAGFGAPPPAETEPAKRRGRPPKNAATPTGFGATPTTPPAPENVAATPQLEAIAKAVMELGELEQQIAALQAARSAAFARIAELAAQAQA